MLTIELYLPHIATNGEMMNLFQKFLAFLTPINYICGVGERILTD